jgi:Protein of unknown function (DUF2934)
MRKAMDNHNNEQESHKRARAYAIWEQEGRPEGQHDEHWARAESELRDQVAEQTSAPTEDKSRAGEAAKAAQMQRGDEAPPGTPGTGENICPTCRGSGQVDQKLCPDCGGTGKVIEGIGGA